MAKRKAPARKAKAEVSTSDAAYADMVRGTRHAVDFNAPTLNDIYTHEINTSRYEGEALNLAQYTRRESIFGLPQFLRDAALAKPPLTADEIKAMAHGRRREWAPIRKPHEWTPKVETPLYIDNRDQPVIVNVGGKAGPKKLADYASMDEFEAKHDKKTYPIRRTVNFEGTTIILVGAKPWAGKEKKAPGEKKPSGRSKVFLIADLLVRPQGCTTKDVLEATGWPAVSMPAQAKLAGLKLRKEKVGKVTTYYGSK